MKVKYSGPMPEETITVQHDDVEIIIDVQAMLSNYGCIYGRGCQGTATAASGKESRSVEFRDRSTMGCCRTAPHLDLGDDGPDRISEAVDSLEAQDCENIKEITEGGWYEENKKDYQAKTLRGNCIFLNSGGHEKPGCSLWHLAERKGVRPQDVRPKVCHTDPVNLFRVGEDASESKNPRRLLTLRPHWYGWFNIDGWYCTKAPEAYQESEPVYQSMREQIEWLVQDDSLVEKIVSELDTIWSERHERVQREQWGKPVFLPEPGWVERERKEGRAGDA